MKREKLAVFVDTNVFLHFPPMKDIDWVLLANANQVDLVVCMTVINELDAKKSDSRLGSRADRAIKEIGEAIKVCRIVRESVTLNIFNHVLRSSDFPDTLSPDSADDRIVHLASVYKKEHGGAPVAIATGDLGMTLRAPVGGIEFIELDKSLRLENPADELVKKNRELVAENSKLKNRIQVLSLGLSPKDEEFSLSTKTLFSICFEKKEIDVESELAKIHNRYPKYVPPNKNKLDPDIEAVEAMHARLMGGLSQTEKWDEYNSKLEQFYKKYEEYLCLLGIIHEVRSRSFWFDVWLANEGSCPATDIDVSIEFPALIKAVGRIGTDLTIPVETLPDPPNPPKKPATFRSTEIPYMGIGTHLGRELPKFHDLHMKDNDNFDPSVEITKIGEDFRRITIHLRKLKHGHSSRIGTFLAFFSPDESIRTFGTEYSISSTELPTRLEGKMPFLIEVNSIANSATKESGT
jgi:rRNA-processing protein FCF1